MTLNFGTSGVRGLISELTNEECYKWTIAFLRYLESKNYIQKGNFIALARDLRESSPRIMAAIATAINDSGYKIDNCGKVPTPAITYYSINRNQASIMITGSHVPEDRNGIKFILPLGEVLKNDEAGISEEYNQIKNINYKANIKLPEAHTKAREEYVDRYINIFSNNLFKNKKIAVYQHSTVAKEILIEIFQKLGAEVIPMGLFDHFVSFDTENLRSEDFDFAKKVVEEYKPFAIVSADGDGDRPLLFDEKGEQVRGDIIPVLSSIYLEADSISCTVSSNTVVEKVNFFKKVTRTRIGSPYIIEGMEKDINNDFKRAISYEANGGYINGTDLNINGKILKALPTRDSMLPLITVILFALEKNLLLSSLVQTLPQRYTFSNKLQNFSTENSKKLVSKFSKENSKIELEKTFGYEVESINYIDGVKVFLKNQDIFHFRPSGNAPELRCYTESDTQEKAVILNKIILDKLKSICS